MSLDLTEFSLVSVQENWEEGVVMVHNVCGERIVGEAYDGIGTGDPEDNTLDRLTFLAQDHVSLYCKGDQS